MEHARMGAVVAMAWALVGCAAQVDPCATISGACLSVRVEGSGKVDTVELVASGPAFTGAVASSFGGPRSLPVRFAAIPVIGAKGDVTLGAAGLLAGATIGTGSVQVAGLTGNGDRRQVVITLEAHGGPDLSAPVDGGSDGGCTPIGAPLACSDPSTLSVCAASGGTSAQPCAEGCATSPSPHCKTIVPHLPVDSTTIAGAASAAAVLTDGITLNTDNGLFSNYRTTPATGTTRDVQGGVSFQVIGTQAVFTMDSLMVSSGANVRIVGHNGFVLVARNDITILGTLDARPTDGASAMCPATGGFAPGGYLGGVFDMDVGNVGVNGSGGGMASGGGMSNGGEGGGGGGGNLAMGGVGGQGFADDAPVPGGSAGDSYMLAFPIVGGGGGGSGSGNSGGGGGAAIHLVAGGQLAIGDPSVLGGINVSGCGGAGGTTMGDSSPAGGGAGGTILLEGFAATLDGMGSLVANGGGGGATNGVAGNVSGIDGAAAQGGVQGGAGSGGTGGATGLLAGGDGGSPVAPVEANGGGAGGAAGRIVVFDVSGKFTPTGSAKTSPTASDTGGDGQLGVTVGQSMLE